VKNNGAYHQASNKWRGGDKDNRAGMRISGAVENSEIGAAASRKQRAWWRHHHRHQQRHIESIMAHRNGGHQNNGIIRHQTSKYDSVNKTK